MFFVIFLMICCILSGCSGNAEASETATIYVPERLMTSSGGGYRLPDGFEDPIYEDGSLYFMQGNSNMQAVSRAALAQDGGVLEVMEAENLFTLTASGLEWEGEAERDPTEEEVLSMLDQAVEAGAEAVGQPEKQVVRMDPEKIYLRFFLKDYAVDQEQNLYLAIEYSKGSYFGVAYEGCFLCKRTQEGEWIYRSYFPEMELSQKGFAVDGEGGICFLAEEEMIALDRNGKKVGQVKTDGEENLITKMLLGDAEGHVYYLIYENLSLRWEGRKLDRREGLTLQAAEGLSGTFGLGSVAVCEGNVIYSAMDTLYGYDPETAQAESILLWGNSNLIEAYVESAIRIDDDRILIQYEEPKMSGLYLLRNVPLEELQEKETVVLAAPGASYLLSNAVIQFNRQSDEYRVVMETYGYDEEAEGAEARRNAAIVSSHPPDLLVLAGLDVEKSVEKGLLEDLVPYLDKSSVVDKSDFLENVLEGYTFGGVLAGIPTDINISILAGRASQVGNLDKWTMEEVYRLAEQYPEQTRLLSDGSDYELNTRQYLLERFCAFWYLEEFVDWESGKCHFDSEAFRELLKWVGENGKEQGSAEGNYLIADTMPEDVLLMDNWVDFEAAARWEMMFGEAIKLLGYPTADGKGKAYVRFNEPMGIMAKAGNKEGAWAFLEFYLSQASSEESALTTSKSQLQRQMEAWVKPDVIDESADRKYFMTIGGELVPMYGGSRELEEQVMAFLEEADFTPNSSLKDSIVGIVLEESESYYNGDKNLEEVTGIIQNRVQLLMDENR